jgi:hypothetical protein
VKREFGTGNIRVELEDYFSETREMSFNHLPSDYNFPLRPKQGKISILSTPSGASVNIDGKAVGKTPWLGQMLEGGRHTVRLSLDQFEDWSENVDIKASKSVSLAPTLTAIQLRSLSSSESVFEKKNLLKKVAPIGKWVSAGVSAFSWLLYLMNDSVADDEYSNYRSGTEAREVEEARQAAIAFDKSASINRTIGVLSGLVSVGFFAVEWNTNQDQTANLQPKFSKGSLSFELVPVSENFSSTRYALTLQFQ